MNEEKESRADENVEEFPEDTWTEDPNFDNRLTGNTDTLMHQTDVRSLNKMHNFAPGENQIPL